MACDIPRPDAVLGLTVSERVFVWTREPHRHAKSRYFGIAVLSSPTLHMCLSFLGWIPSRRQHYNSPRQQKGAFACGMNFFAFWQVWDSQVNEILPQPSTMYVFYDLTDHRSAMCFAYYSNRCTATIRKLVSTLSECPPSYKWLMAQLY